MTVDRKQGERGGRCWANDPPEIQTWSPGFLVFASALPTELGVPASSVFVHVELLRFREIFAIKMAFPEM